jgi:ribonucleoside-diphosphate reductase alpha chain
MSDFVDPVKTPEGLPGVRVRIKTPAGHMHVIISVDVKAGRELEVFATVGRSSGLPHSNAECICRMISLFLRIGGTLPQVVEQLNGVGACDPVLTADGQVVGLGDGISKAIEKYLEAKAKYGLEAILTGEVDLQETTDGR